MASPAPFMMANSHSVMRCLLAGNSNSATTTTMFRYITAEMSKRRLPLSSDAMSLSLRVLANVA